MRAVVYRHFSLPQSSSASRFTAGAAGLLRARCERSIMLSDRLRAKSALPSAFRRQNDAEYNALVLTHLSRSTDVSATIGRDHVVDLVVGNTRPCTVHFNFVVVANHTTLGLPTIHQIAA